MANITDLIAKAVASQAGSINVPAGIKDKVLGGISDSVLGSLTQTAMSKGGVEQITALVTGKSAAASSPVTALAGKLLTSNLSSLKLDSKQMSAIQSIIPMVMGKLGGIIKDQDGDGDIDLNDILLTLKGGNANAGSGALGSIAKGVLGSLLKK